MKKIFNLMLVAIFILSMVPMAFAELGSNEDGSIHSDGQVNVPKGSFAEISPLPPGADMGPLGFNGSVVKSKAVKAAKTNLATKKDIRGLSSRIKGLEGQTGRLAKETKASSEAVSNMADNMNGLTNAVGNTTAATRNLSDRVGGVEKSLAAEAKNLGDQIYGNAILFGVCGIIAFALLVVIIAEVIRRNRANINLQPLEDGVEIANRRIEGTNRGIEVILDEVRAGFAEMRTDHAELPQRTADAVKAFDPRPIEVTAAGHHAVFTQSAEATAASVYQYFEVDEDVDPSITADAYELLTTSNRDKAYDKIRQIVREYYNGSLQRKAAAGSNAAKLKIALVDHYRDATGQLVVTAV